MRPLRHAAVILFAASLAAAPSALADEADAPAAAAPAQKEATKSRSNIQNNREGASPPASTPAPPAPPSEVLKTKTRSNQSND